MGKLKNKIMTVLAVAVSVFAPVLTVVSSVTAETTVTSTDRRIGAIKTAFQKLGADGADVTTLTADELRIIGVFMSNFYVPFSTELGSTTNDESVTKTVKEQMVSILQTHLQYSSEVATKLVEKIYAISNGAKPLYFATGNKNDTSIGVKLVNDSKGQARPAYFYEFLIQALATDSTYLTGVEGNTGSKYPFMVFDPVSNPFGYLTTTSGSAGSNVSDKSIAFDYSPYGGDSSTPSQLMLAMIMQNLDKVNSIGTSLFDLTEDEMGKVSTSNTDVIDALLNHYGYTAGFTGTIEKLYKASIFNWQMYVDSFGNILVDTGSRRYVAIPAALNPYVFEGANSKRGDSIPLNNLQTYTTYRYNNTITSNGSTANIGNVKSSEGFVEVDGKSAFKVTKGYNITQWDLTGFLGVVGITTDDIGAYIRDQLVTQYLVNNHNITSAAQEKGLLNADVFSNGWLKTGRATDSSSGGGKFLRNETFKDSSLYQTAFTDTGTGATLQGSQYLTQPIGEMFAGLGGADNFFIPKSNVTAKSNIPSITTVIAPDFIGTLKQGKGFDEDGFKTMQISKNYLGDRSVSEMDSDKRGLFKSLTSDRSKLAYVQGSAWNSNYSAMAANLFVTYVMTGMTSGQSVDTIKTKFGFVIADSSNFPSITDSLLNTTSDTTDGTSSTKGLSDAQRATMEIWQYETLNPESNSGYHGRLFKTTANSMLLQMHRDITGSNESQLGSGATKYTGVLSYMSMPSLSDLSFTRDLLKTFQNYSIYLILAVALIVFMTVILGEISVVRGIINVIAFALLLSVPAFIMQWSADTSNGIANKFYTDKFNYFSLIQNQIYTTNYDKTAQAGVNGQTEDYTQGLMTVQGDTQTGMYSGNGTIGASTTVKWMTPKKFGFTDQLQEEIADNTGVQSQAFSLLSRSILRKGLMGESYDANTNATYLYRSFSDIGNYSRNIYGNISGDSTYGSGSITHNLDTYDSALTIMGLESVKKYYSYDSTNELGIKFKIANGFINATKNAQGSTNLNEKDFKRLFAPISSTLIAKTTTVDASKINLGDKVGVDSNAFKVDVNNYNNHSVELISGLKNMGTITSQQATSIGVFALYTESPFYYFSWSLYDNGMSVKPDATDGFSKMVLNNNSGFFYNYTITGGQAGYGALKDYLDMSTLFNVTIPYLRAANKPVEQFTQAFGAYPYTNIPSDDASASRFTDKTSDNYYKYWFNNNLNRMYNQYTAWVDTMSEADYAKPTSITYAGKTQRVEDPLNPASYTIRPMVFSESEMAYYGLSKGDLTEVERKILNVLEKTRYDWLQLLNYSKLSDVVINNSAAMIATFNFNKEFSQSSILGNSLELYPQGFELKNFTYDAYLKLILANATSESLLDDTSTIYERIFEKGGVFLGVGVVINDLLAQYVIPSIRWLAILGYFALGLLICLASVLRPKEFKFGKIFTRAFIIPFLGFVFVNFLLAWAISLFIGEGITTVTGSLYNSISIGDPGVTMFIIALIHLAVIGAWGYLLFLCGKNIFTYGKVTWGIVSGIGLAMASTVTSQMTGLGGTLLGGNDTNLTENYVSNDIHEEIDSISVSDAEAMSQVSGNYDGPTESSDDFNYDEIVSQGRDNLYGSGYDTQGNFDVDKDYDELIGNVDSQPQSSYQPTGDYERAEREAKASDMEDLLARDEIDDLDSRY